MSRRRRGRPPDAPTSTDPQSTPPTPPQPDPQPTPQPGPQPPPPTPPAPQPTQVDIDAAVAKALGMPASEAAKLIKRAKDADKAAMTEAERAAAEAREAQEKAQRDAAEAARLAHASRVQIALVRAGVHPDKLEWAARLVAAEPGADDKAVQAAIDAAKAAVPEVFAGAAPTGPVPPAPGAPPSSNPPGSPPAPKPTPDVKAKAAALIAERFPNLAPKPGGSA
jgi:hypothetical protein